MGSATEEQNSLQTRTGSLIISQLITARNNNIFASKGELLILFHYKTYLGQKRKKKEKGIITGLGVVGDVSNKE